VPDEVIARLAAAGLAGVEVWHPEQSQAERDRARRLADELGLVATGGSDDHGALTGYRIGAESTPPEAWRRLAAQASGTPVS
jgi:predicted metal-dependent phosphoesterase TrpH